MVFVKHGRRPFLPRSCNSAARSAEHLDRPLNPQEMISTPEQLYGNNPEYTLPSREGRVSSVGNPTKSRHTCGPRQGAE